MEDTPKYTDLDAESSRKYTNLDSFHSSQPTTGTPQSSGYAPVMDPNNPAGGTYNGGYYSQNPVNPSNGHYNGVMPGQAPRHQANPPQTMYGYPPVEQQSPAGYAAPAQHQQPPPPPANYQMGGVQQPQQGPVNPQYMAQLHSEIEYYKMEVAKMYVMPPSTDLAAKIRDFQNRISYLEEKKQYLVMGSQSNQQMPQGYQQTTMRYPNQNQADSNYMRMSYPRGPAGYPNRQPVPPPQQQQSGHYYAGNQPQPGGYNMQPNGGQAPGYPPYYQQNYQMDPNQQRPPGPVHSGYAPNQNQQYNTQHPSAMGGYQMGPNYQAAQPSAIHQHPQQQQAPPQQHAIRPQQDTSQHTSTDRPAFSSQSVAPRSSPEAVVSNVRPVSPRSSPGTKTEAKSRRNSNSSESRSSDGAMTPQASSLVSSFVQSAFKSKEDAATDESRAAAHVATSNQCQREGKPTQTQQYKANDQQSLVQQQTVTPQTVQPMLTQNSRSPEISLQHQSSPGSNKVEPITVPCFEPCEILIRKQSNSFADLSESSDNGTEASSDEKREVNTELTEVEEPKVFSTLSTHSVNAPENSTVNRVSQSFTMQPVPGGAPARYTPMQPPHQQSYPVRPQPIQPSMQPLRPNMSHPQMPMHGQYRPEYQMQHGCPPGPFLQPMLPGSQTMGPPVSRPMGPPGSQPMVAGPPGMYPPHWVGSGPNGMQPMNGAQAPMPQQPQWGQHGGPPGYLPLTPSGTIMSVRPEAPAARGGKKSKNGNGSAEGKRVKKKKKDTEKAIPDSTTSELGEPMGGCNDLLLCSEFSNNMNDQANLSEEPSSSQCDSASPTKKGKRRGSGVAKPRRGSKKQKDNNNEAEGIDVSSVEVASMEMNATSIETTVKSSSEMTTVELPSPSDVSQSVRKPRRLATKIGNSKKKRKRFNSSDDEIMMPPEELNMPPEAFMEKRRSERSSARTRKNYIADELIDYALGAVSDDDVTLPPDVLLESSTSGSVVEPSTSAGDTVETSSCSTIAGTEDSSSQSLLTRDEKAVGGSVGETPQLLIPAQVETDTFVVEKILISRERTVNKEPPQASPIESVKPEAEAKLTGPEDEPKTKDSENAQDEETPEKDSSAEAAELTDAVKGEPSSSKIEEKNDAGAEVSAAGGSKKITDIKVNTIELAKKSPSAVNVTASGSPPIVVKEYFVKYKGLSYLHCEWATEEVLTYKDKRFPLKLKRFKQKQLENSGCGRVEDCTEEEPFNPEFVEVDRVLDCMLSPDEVDETTGQPKRHFLVKWCSLPYEESTWEMEEDVDVGRIQHYFKINDFKQYELQRLSARKTRPHFKEWKKLDEMPVFKNNNELRDYQLEGINWLLYCYYKHTNCILADEMGLGKTVQSATFLEMVYRAGIHGPFLVIAPLSTICNWLREFEGWTDQNCIVYHGSQISRNMIQQYEMFHKDPKTGKLNKKLYKFTALVTTYEVLLADCMDVFKEIEWQVCIIDEAHRLKNKKCKLMDGLNMLYMDHIVLLTGTPLQNNVDELFSLLNFLDPVTFNNNQEFMNDFGTLQSEDQVNKLQAILKPLMLRRLKEDVERSIAPKEETIIEVELTNVQKTWYRAIIEKNFSHIAKSASGGVRALPNLMNTMMELRKCCNHPFLLNGVEEQILNEFASAPEVQYNRYLDALIQSCGKIVLIDKLLPKLKESNHRVLIFSQMVRCLDIIEDYIQQRNYSFERIDGGVRGLQRQAAIDRFSKPGSDKFIFLLCTKAGGLGINLTAADTVIIYDSDWNPQNDLQAQARCHRIGQKKHVQVYRLITKNTYEREMFDRASQKLGLDKAVLQTMSGRKGAAVGGTEGDGTAGGAMNAPMSKKEVEDLLKKGAYGAVMEDDDAAQKFCEEDIDQILKKRTQVIKIESEAVGSTFSKASFTSNDANNDIDLNDPNFWEKWAQKANVDYGQALKDDRILEAPRQRRQTRRFEYSQVNDDMYGLSESDSDASGSAAESANGKGERASTRKSKKRGATAHTDDNSSDGGQEFVRSDLYQCEKGLLTFGWGNWLRIIEGFKFRRDMTTKLVEDLCRCILAYALQWYQGDDKIRKFVYELITPDNDNIEILKSHAAQSCAAPRGRKSTRNKSEKSSSETVVDDNHWSNGENLEAILGDATFRKHVRYQCNKVLIRVRTLFFIHHEIIDDLAEKVNSGANHSEIPLEIAPVDVAKPCEWWDEACDKCLFIGVFKHGYDQFTKIRNDPTLCFVSLVGESEAEAQDTLDEDDLENEDVEVQNVNGEESDVKKEPTEVTEDKEKEENKSSDPEKSRSGNDDETNSQESISNADAKTNSSQETKTLSEDTESSEQFANLWPPASALNNRLRKVIAALQKLSKKQKLMLEKRKTRLEKMAVVNATKPVVEVKEKWAKREENDFYKTISTFGLQYTKDGDYVWNKFRMIASLNRKSDGALTQYCDAFKSMCERVCGIKIEPLDDVSHLPQIEPITEDRARKTLHRIELMRRIRLDAIYNPLFEKRIKLCQSALDMPSWWIAGEHDRDLMFGVANHGILRSEVNLLQDPQLCFLRVKDEIMKSVQRKHDEKVAKFKKERDGESTNPENEAAEATATSNVNLATEEKTADNNEKDSSKATEVNDQAKDEEVESKENVDEDKAKEEAPEVKPEIKSELDRQSSSPVPVNITDMLGVAYLVQWPKDRVLLARLEKICTCIENGSWPTLKWTQPPPVSYDKNGGSEVMPGDEVLETQSAKAVLKSQLLGESFEGMSSARTASEAMAACSFKPGRRGRASNSGVHLPASLRKQSNASSSGVIADEKSLSKLRELFEKQGSAMDNETPLACSFSGIGGIMDLSMKAGTSAASASSRYTNSERSTPDSRAEDADISDQGSVIAGSETPDIKRRTVGSSKRKRKHTSVIIDPSKLDVDNINGSEHVAVVDRISGVKIEGSDAPILNNVVDFLYKNSTFDIAPEWEVIVKAQKRFPSDLIKRVAGLNPGGSPESKKLKQSGKQLYSPARSVSQSSSASPARVSSANNVSSADLLSQAALLSSLTSMSGGNSMNPFASIPNLPNLPLTPDLASLGLFNPMLSMFPQQQSQSSDHKSASSLAAAAAQSAALNYQLASLAAVSLNPLLAQSLNPFASLHGLGNPFGGGSNSQDSAMQLAGLSALLSGSLPPGLTADSLLSSLSQPVSNASMMPNESNSKAPNNSSSQVSSKASNMSPKASEFKSGEHSYSPRSPAIGGSNSPGNSKSVAYASPSTTPKSSSNMVTSDKSGSSTKSQRSSPPAASASTGTSASPVNTSTSNLLPNIPQLSPNDLLAAASLGSLPFMMPPSMPPFLSNSQSPATSNASVLSNSSIPGFDLSAAGLEAAQLAALASLCAGGGITPQTQNDIQGQNLFGSSPLYPNSDLSRLTGLTSDSFMNEQNALLARMQKELAEQMGDSNILGGYQLKDGATSSITTSSSQSKGKSNQKSTSNE